MRRDINTFHGEDRNRLVRAYQRALPEQVEAIVSDGIAAGELAAADPGSSPGRMWPWSRS